MVNRSDQSIHHRGFNLVEMLVTIAIIAILVSVSVPGFIDTIKRSQIKSHTHSVAKFIALGRSEAIDRFQTQVIMCVSTDRVKCAENNTTWESGWILFPDLDGDQKRDINTEALIRIQPEIDNGTTVRFFNNGKKEQRIVTFNSEGLPQSSGAFVVCNSLGATQAKALMMNASGQTRLATDDDDDITVNFSSDIDSGNNITCP